MALQSSGARVSCTCVCGRTGLRRALTKRGVFRCKVPQGAGAGERAPRTLAQVPCAQKQAAADKDNTVLAAHAQARAQAARQAHCHPHSVRSTDELFSVPGVAWTQGRDRPRQLWWHVLWLSALVERAAKSGAARQWRLPFQLRPRLCACDRGVTNEGACAVALHSYTPPLHTKICHVAPPAPSAAHQPRLC